MSGLVTYMTVTSIICILMIGIVYQVRDTVKVVRLNNDDTRNIVFNMISCIALIAFLISYILNFLVSSNIIMNTNLTCDNTSFSCFIWMVIIGLSRYKLMHKKTI